MRDSLDLGSAPAMEPSAQVGREDYWPCAQRECRVFIALIRRTVGPEPPGACLRVKSNPHDFGTYLSVVCEFDSADEAAVAYAYRCDAEMPHEWDDEARRELENYMHKPERR